MNLRLSTRGFSRLKILLAVVLVAVAVLAAERLFHLKELSVIKEKVIIIQGEEPAKSNYTDGKGYIAKDFKFFGDRALQLSAPEAIPGGYYVEYAFSVPEDNDYNIIMCGTPPGPLRKGSPWHSPYTVSIDRTRGELLYEETIEKNWPVFTQFRYVEGGYYFVKLMTVYLKKGEHTIRITVNRPRANDGNYTLYIDALLISPKGYRPFISSKKIPKELFESL